MIPSPEEVSMQKHNVTGGKANNTSHLYLQ